MQMLQTNCLNCGAIIERHNGIFKCEYCGTEIKLANELDILYDNFFGMFPIELILNIKQGDTILQMPLAGKINDVTISSETTNAVDHFGNVIKRFITDTNVDFTFSGRIQT